MLKTIPDPGFAGDDGTAPPQVARALAAYDAGRGSAADVAVALLGTRVMVAVVAIAEEVDAETGAEKQTDMNVVLLDLPDGRRAMPAFTSLASMTAWYPEARPVPVEAERACLAAIAEGADLLVLDPGGPVAFGFEGATLRALARGREPVPPLRDPEVADAVREVLEAEDGVAAAMLLPAVSASDCTDTVCVTTADALLGLVPVAGLASAEASALTRRVAGALAAHPLLRERLNGGLDLALFPGGGVPPAARAAGTILLDRLVR
jgi:hypothetical protein